MQSLFYLMMWYIFSNQDSTNGTCI
jgi:hypothetical protein